MSVTQYDGTNIESSYNKQSFGATAMGASPSTTTEPLMIASQPNSDGGAYTGSIEAALVFDTELTTVQRDAIYDEML